MFYFNLYLTLIVISPGLLLVFLNLYYGQKIEKNQQKFLIIQARITSILKELISIFPMLKIFNLSNWANKRFEKANDDYYSTAMDFIRISSLNISFNTFITGIPIILFIIFGGDLVIRGGLSVGTFTAFLSYISMFFAPISQLSSFWNLYKSSIPAIDRIKEIMDAEIEKVDGEVLNLKNGTITFENVDFAYENNPILKGFNAQFNKGLNYIVGENGAGKSTIMQLICGLHKADKGEIRIDKQNIDNLQQKSLLEHVSIVFSNPYLFKGSVYENIIVGNLRAGRGDVEDVCKLVELDAFIDSKDEGYGYDIGEAGQLLSSGERQKLALARALIRRTPILLLDEATKSIDEETRKIMNNTIKKIQDKKTIIIITHNLSEIETRSNIIKI